MLNRVSFYFCILTIPFFITFYSCSNRAQVDKVPLQKIVRDNYTDKITVGGEFESVNPQNINCPSVRQDVTIQYLVEDGTYVYRGDTLVILDSPELLNRYNDALKNLERSESDYNKSKAGLYLKYLMLQAQVETIETTDRITLLDSVQLRFSSPVRKQVIELELRKSQIEKEKILKQLEFLKKINDSELQQMQLRIKQQESRLSRVKETLDELVIISQSEGYAVRALSWVTGDKVKEGDIVWGRFPLLQIPELSAMQIKLTLNETNFKRVKKNQKVYISIDAMPGLEMLGKIKFKEPVGKPVKRDSKVKVFGAIVSIDTLMGKVMPGITAKCDIIINEINDTLVIPYISVFDDDSNKVAYVLNDNRFEKRVVELVTYNNNTGVIKSGVLEGDFVALMKPPESLTNIEKKFEFSRISANEKNDTRNLDVP